MKIIVTDGYTLNPGDLSWSGIEKSGEVVVYDRSTEAQLPERCAAADIILTNKVQITEPLINQIPTLKLIAVTATGYNCVDVEAARKRNIVVCNVPDYGTASVAQHTMALLLEMTNRVGVHASSVKQGAWERSSDFCYTIGNLTELTGKTFGIIGLGKIGTKVAALANAFGMHVIYHSRQPRDAKNARYTDLWALCATSDIISLHCPLTNENKGFVNRDLLLRMKPAAMLINTSRGQLIHEQDLADALNSGKIAGAALDVLSTEPPAGTNPLLTAKNCIITPHNAWMSREARERMMNITAQNVENFLGGSPVNVVS